MEIKRYECWKTESGTTFDVADPVGKFVLYDDHKAKVESLEARIAELTQGEPAYYRYRHSEQEKWHYGPTPQGWWECQALYPPLANSSN